VTKKNDSGTLAGCLGIVILISLVIAIIQWTFLNILGILGIISVIAGFYYAINRNKYNLTLYWPVFSIVNGFLLALFWFSFKEPLNTLACLLLCSFVYFLITAIVMLIRKNVMWKRYSGITAASLVLSIIFLSISPQIETAKSEKTISNQETSKEDNEENKNNDSKAVPTDTASVNNDEEKQKAQKEEQEKQEVEKVASEPKNKEASEKIAAEQKAKQEAEKKQKEKAANLGLVAATVARVVDGDTFELTDGRKVRLIGVNTPESTTRTEEYGKEASNYTSSKLTGKQVWLQKDVSETDRYGRLLRIVWLQIPNDDMNESEIRSKMFNADLVLNGYAEPATYPPDVKYAEYFRKFAREAREKEVGLWAYGEYGTTKGDLDPRSTGSSSSSSSKSSNSSNQSGNKGSSNNNSSSGSSSSPSTSSSGGAEYFANCTELRKVYPNGVPADHPAYQSKMDRDKDNYACER